MISGDAAAAAAVALLAKKGIRVTENAPWHAWLGLPGLQNSQNSNSPHKVNVFFSRESCVNDGW